MCAVEFQKASDECLSKAVVKVSSYFHISFCLVISNFSSFDLIKMT